MTKAWGTQVTARRASQLERAVRGWEGQSGREWRETDFATSMIDDAEADLDDLPAAWELATHVGEPRGPFDGVELDGADVYWLLSRALAGPAGDIHAAAAKLKSSAHSEEALHLGSVNLSGALLDGADLRGGYLARVRMIGAQMRQALLQGAVLSDAKLALADLSGSQMSGARLDFTDLRAATLREARLDGADLTQAHLQGSVLSRAYFDERTSLSGTDMRRAVLDGAIYNNVGLADIQWARIQRVGDEIAARRCWMGTELEFRDGRRDRKAAEARSYEYESAGRAYRSLAVVLRSEGLGKWASRYQYRAELMDRRSGFWTARAALFDYRSTYMLRTARAVSGFSLWLASALLGALTGYGNRIGRLFTTYIVIVLAFATVYMHVLYRSVTLRRAFDMLALSATAFHGRGITSIQVSAGNGVGTFAAEHIVWLTALEAVFGLLLEGLLIASFVRRISGN